MQSETLIDLPVILGPTAVGKTAVAVRVAEHLNAEIISADSRQVYRGTEIGSGAPSQEELQRVPHHMVGILDPEERLSAGEYARMANAVIADVRSRGKLPIVVGGSGLYIRALTEGVSPIPQSDPAKRDEIRAEIEKRGMREMIRELAEVDPKYAAKIGQSDVKRLIRALEVWRSTGRSFTSWHKDSTFIRLYSPHYFGLIRPRTELWKIIEARVEKMMNAGWKAELRKLSYTYGGYEHLPRTVTECLGYREVIANLQGELNQGETIERIVISTRQFAKRQMSWFNAEKHIKWLKGSGSDATDLWASQLLDEIGKLTSASANNV